MENIATKHILVRCEYFLRGLFSWYEKKKGRGEAILRGTKGRGYVALGRFGRSVDSLVRIMVEVLLVCWCNGRCSSSSVYILISPL